MTDIPGSELSAWEIADHTLVTLNERFAHCPPPPAKRALSYPSWKVIVSASRGQKLNRPGSLARPFFMRNDASFRGTRTTHEPGIFLILARFRITPLLAGCPE